MMANGIYFGINDSIGKSIEIIDNEIFISRWIFQKLHYLLNRILLISKGSMDVFLIRGDNSNNLNNTYNSKNTLYSLFVS